MRYFAKISDDGTPPVGLSRLNLDIPHRISEEAWAYGHWSPTKEIVRGLVTGSNDYDEVSEAYARAAFPDAFATKGGLGSGNHGHAGRPGEVGGSAPSGSDFTLDKAGIVGVLGIQDLPQEKIVDYLAKRGRYYGHGAPLPDGIKLGVKNQCYKNATQSMWEHPNLTYVEGVAWRDGSPGLAILHGWNSDASNGVVDTTLRDSKKWSYFGVEYDRKDYMAHITKTMMYGVLGGDSKSAKAVLARGGLTKGRK
jgi:hypothetical protein